MIQLIFAERMSVAADLVIFLNLFLASMVKHLRAGEVHVHNIMHAAKMRWLKSPLL